MKRKVLGVLLSVAMVATMVAGCGSSSEPAATDDAAATEEAGAVHKELPLLAWR